MNRGRAPNLTDLRRMQRALALVTAYDLGSEEKDFDQYVALSKEESEPEAMVHALTQFAWLLLKSFEEQGIPRANVLDWYGKRFALSAEEKE
jgi:hypothetical protein